MNFKLSEIFRDITRFLYDKGAVITEEIAVMFSEEIFRLLRSKTTDVQEMFKGKFCTSLITMLIFFRTFLRLLTGHRNIWLTLILENGSRVTRTILLK